MIKINIVKLPPEAQALAREIEDTLAQMVSKTVKSMVGVGNNLENLEITVYEAFQRFITEQRGALAKLAIAPETEVEPEVPAGFYDFEATPQYITPSPAFRDKQLDDCINLFVQFPDFVGFREAHPECASIIQYFQGLSAENPAEKKRKVEFEKKLAAARKKEEDRKNYPVG